MLIATKNLATMLVLVPKKLWRTPIGLKSNVSIAKELAIALAIAQSRVRIDLLAVIASTLRSVCLFHWHLLI